MEHESLEDLSLRDGLHYESLVGRAEGRGDVSLGLSPRKYGVSVGSLKGVNLYPDAFVISAPEPEAWGSLRITKPEIPSLL